MKSTQERQQAAAPPSQVERASRDGYPPVLLVGSLLSGHRGSFGVTEALAARLEARGWSVRTTSRLKNPIVRAADMMWTAWSERGGYDVAHVDVFSGRAFRWAEAACLVLRRARKPYLLTLRGGNLPAFARSHPRRVTRLLESAQTVLVPSRYLLDRMSTYHDDMHLLRNPLDLSLHASEARSTVEPRLIWVRAFHEIYHPTLAIQVLERVQKHYPDARLIMVGPDKGDGSLQRTQELARELGVSNHVTFAGQVPKTEVPRWLDRADIFLNTTTVDNAPVSVLEAMASGLCVVTTEVGGIPYMLDHGDTALLVPPADVEAMAGAVLRVLDDPRLAGSLSHAGRREADQHDWDRLILQWESLFRAAADGAPWPSGMPS